MYYGTLKTCDVANGPGVRVTLFVSGCTNRCEGCFQPETWDFHYGTEYTKETEAEVLKALEPSYIRGLTILGGEPFEPDNQRVLAVLVKKVRECFPAKDIWCYTGFILDQDLIPGGKKYCEATDELLDHIDVLVDGRFEQDKKNLSLAFRGSENQRIIDLRGGWYRKLPGAEIVLWKLER